MRISYNAAGAFELYIFAGMWDALVDVVAALQHADGSVKRQWLVDAVEISCVSSYPSMVGDNTFCRVNGIPLLQGCCLPLKF